MTTRWHAIRGFDRRLSKEANIERGVDLPENGKDILVMYPKTDTETVYVKKAKEEGMMEGRSCTEYADDIMWAYFDKPNFIPVASVYPYYTASQAKSHMVVGGTYILNAEGKQFSALKEEIDTVLRKVIAGEYEKMHITHIVSSDFLELYNIKDDITDTNGWNCDWWHSFCFDGKKIKIFADAFYGNIVLSVAR